MSFIPTTKVLPTQNAIIRGEGPKDAKIVIVGEAPGEMESRFGRPFVGMAGKLLDDNLHRAGILRRRCYLTNVVKEHPPKNNIDKFIKFSSKGYAQHTPDYDKHEAFLKAELEELNPNIVIAVGNVALYALCRLTSVTKYRGSILESTLIPGLKVIPIIHPAAALRAYMFRHFILFDLIRARTESFFPEIREPKREYIVGSTFKEYVDYLEICATKRMVAFDIEVTNGGVHCISFAYNDSTAVSVPFIAEGGGDYFDPQQEAYLWRLIARILENPKIVKLGQNVTFDSTFLFRVHSIKCRNMRDTMVLMAVLYPDFPKDLGFITSIYTTMPYYKDEGKELFKRGIDASIEQFWLYNAKDSIVLMEAYPKMLEEVDRIGNTDTYETQVALIEPLLFMTEFGIRMDVEGMKAKSEEVTTELHQLQMRLNKASGMELNPRSPKQLLDYFYVTKGMKPYLKGGKPTTDESALKRLARKGLVEADILLRMRELGKLQGTYLDMSIDADGRVRSSMNPVGTRYGRLSSSKTIFGTGANMQNQPPMMKKFMLADENMVAYEIDLSQAENRVVAYLGPDPTMINAFEKGIDIHSQTAALIFGKPIEEISAEDGSSRIGSGKHSERFWGKKANHAFNYGQGYRAFSFQVEIMENEGKFIWSRYHEAYPGVRRYWERVKEQLKSTKTLTNVFGRKYFFMDRWGDEMFEKAYAFNPQSTVADKINRHGVLEIYNNQDKYEHVYLLNQIHDSVLIEIPVEVGFEYHAQVLHHLKESLEQPLEIINRIFSIPADIKMLPVNLLEGGKVSIKAGQTIQETAAQLEQTYKKLTNGNEENK